MLNLNLKEVLQLSKKYNVIPVFAQTSADMETPLSAYMKIDNPEYSFLLESVEGGENTARYSFLGREPYEIFAYANGNVFRESKGKKIKYASQDPLGELRKIFTEFKVAPVAGLPRFHGGAIGYMGYDAVKLYEKIPAYPKKDLLGWPDIFYMFTDILLVFDHVYHNIKAVCNIFIETGDTAAKIKTKYEKAVSKINLILKDVDSPLETKHLKKHKGKIKIKEVTGKNKYKEMVAFAVKEIKNGEAIQVVPSQRFTIDYNGDPLNIYRALRTINPSPYMHFIRFGDNRIIGASPEVMVRYENGEIYLRPIAGTRPRGKSAAEDTALELELLADVKERAEHVMLVDLARNDIGKVAKVGSVKVKDFMTVEKYSHVMHIVSGVTGKIKPGLDGFDVFKSTFPAGTVSGAPKVRAMQMIEQMETIKRGLYAGAVGYISFSGNIDSCISIRTAYYCKGKVHIQAGAGIVADSDPEFEYKESMNKAMAMMKAVKTASEE
ncbi:MAG: anthranilate synthase component I [bacterium]